MSDVGGAEILCLAGQTLDRAEELAERIRTDGTSLFEGRAAPKRGAQPYRASVSAARSRP
jgi:hypothetical protein